MARQNGRNTGRRPRLSARLEPSRSRRQQRAVLAVLVMFIDLNHGTWDRDQPAIDEAEEAMLAIAGGDVVEAWTAAWLR